MSDIRFNRWLHQSGTGGVYQDGSGRVGIGSSTPTDALDIVGVASATSFFGPLTGNVTGNVTGDITSSGTSTFDVISGVSTIGVTTVHLTAINNLGYPTAGPLSNRNLIANGAMQVWQRNDSLDSTSVSNDSNEYYQTVDRFAFKFGNNADGGVGIARTTDVPANQGFSNAYRVDVETSVTPTTTMIIYPEYVIESQDIRNSGWNYNDSSSYITVSFWTKSNKTGTYNLGAYTDDGTRQFFTNEYTISSSDTWERKEISIPGAAGIQFNNDEGIGLRINWHLSIGPSRNDGTSGSWSSNVANFSTPNQVNFMDDTANEWYLTGVQVEVGGATPFEHRSYGDELARCQRYCYAAVADGSIDNYAPLANGRYYSATNAQFNIFFPVTMRTPPSLDSSTTAVGTFFYNTGGGFGGVEATQVTLNERSYNNATVTTSGATGQTAGDGTTLYSHDEEVAKLIFTSEF